MDDEIVEITIGITPYLLTRDQLIQYNKARDSGAEYIEINGLEIPTHHNGQKSLKEIELNEKLAKGQWLCLYGYYHWESLFNGISFSESNECSHKCNRVSKQISQERFVKRRILNLLPGTELTSLLNDQVGKTDLLKEKNR